MQYPIILYLIATPLIDVTGIVLIARLLSASKAGFLTASW